MTPAEKRLAANLLRIAADEFRNHGYNDFDLVCDGGMLASEADDFRKRFYTWNGNPKEWKPNRRMDLADFAAMSFLAHLLEQEGLGVASHKRRCSACGQLTRESTAGCDHCDLEDK